MFGGIRFGGLSFGQAGSEIPPLAVTVAIQVATGAALLTGPGPTIGIAFAQYGFGQYGQVVSTPLASQKTMFTVGTTSDIVAPVYVFGTATCSIATDGTLNIGGPLITETVIFSFNTEATLRQQARLMGSAAISIGTNSPPVAMTADLRSQSALTVSVGDYRSSVLGDGPSAYWRLNESGFGNSVGAALGQTEFGQYGLPVFTDTAAIDSTGNGHTGTVSGGVIRSQPGPLSDGDPAMAFDGTSGKILTVGSFNLPHSSAYSNKVVADGAISYWHLDETSGTTAVDVVNGRHGTITGGVTLGQSPAIAAGKSYNFPGVNTAYVTVPATSALELSTVSVEVWAYPLSGANGGLVEKTISEAVNRTWLLFEEGGFWNWRIVNPLSGYVSVIGPVAVTNQWAHVVGTVDSSVACLYVNGVLVASAPYTGPPPQGSGSLKIGILGSSIYPFSGSIDEVAIYPTALTPTQVADHYALRNTMAGGYTVQSWINTPPGAGSGQEPYLSTRDGVGNIGGVYFGVSAGKAFTFNNTSGSTLGGKIIADNQWHHVVQTYDGVTMRTYVDGVLDIATAKAIPPALWNDAQIAWDTSTGNFFQGGIDELAIYPKVLTPEQIAAHYAVRVGNRLNIGSSLAVAAAPAFALASAVTLRSLPATFSTTAGVRIGAVANMVVIGYGFSQVVIAFNGAITTAVRRGSINISDELNEAPNTCEFIVDGIPPNVGTDVRIGLANLSNLLFGGTVIKTTQIYELKKSQPSWQVSCRDYTFLINRRKVFAQYTDISATAAANALLDQYVTGVSRYIEAGLANITVKFDGVDVMDAMSQLASLVGGYVNVTAARVIQLYITPPNEAPNPVDGTDPLLLLQPPISIERDLSQVRSVIKLKGKGASVVGNDGMALPAGSPTIPIDDASPFSSGTVIADDLQILQYSGTAMGGQASVVTGNVPGPTGAPLPALASGVAGRLSGTYQWAIAFSNANGETPVGPRTGPLVAPDVLTPTTTVGVGATGAVGPLVGTYGYRVSFLTTLGETLPGPMTSRTAQPLTFASGGFAVGTGSSGISRLKAGIYQWLVTYVTQYGETTPIGAVVSFAMQNPTPPPAPTVQPWVPGVVTTPANYSYVVTFITQDGETYGGFGASVSTPLLSQPTLQGQGSSGFGGVLGGPYFYGVSAVTREGEAAPPLYYNMGSGFFAAAPTFAPFWNGGQDTNGRIGNGQYWYRASYFNETFGETALGPSSTFSVSTAQLIRVNVSLTPGLPSGATGIRIYRSMPDTQYMLNAEFRGSVPSSYWDPLQQGECGNQYPLQQRAGTTHGLFVNPSSEQNVIGRRIYRTKSGGNVNSDYFLIGELQHNSGAYFYDAVPDEGLTARQPIVNTAGRSPQLTVPVGPSGTVGRRIYRTKANGSQYYLVGEIKDNSTTSWVDTTADTVLTVSVPLVNTAGSGTTTTGGQPRLVNVPIGPSGVIARRIYRTRVNGATFFRVAELPNNTTQIYDDNTPDDALGEATMPAANAGGGETHLLSSIPTGPPGTLGRAIYRTKANGSEVFFLAQISNNTTTTFTDNLADASLGRSAPLVSTAGASAVQLTNIPIGPAGITTRLIFRTKAGGTDLFQVGTLDDNSSSTYLDDKADSSLGRAPEIVSTIGALIGDNVLVLNQSAGWPAPGWVRADNQVISYTGISGTTLVGIPAVRVVSSLTRSGQTVTLTTSGGHGFATGDRVTMVGANETDYNGVQTLTVLNATQATYTLRGTSAPTTPATGQIRAAPNGAIIAPIRGATTVTSVAILTGVSGIARPIPVGDKVSLWVVASSADAIAQLAALERGDGIHEFYIADDSLDSVAACTKRGNAELTMFQYARITVAYRTMDLKSKSGSPVVVNLPPPQNLTGTFMIQTVRISSIDVNPRTYPFFDVIASNNRYSLQDLLRHVVLDR